MSAAIRLMNKGIFKYKFIPHSYTVLFLFPEIEIVLAIVLMKNSILGKTKSMMLLLIKVYANFQFCT